MADEPAPARRRKLTKQEADLFVQAVAAGYTYTTAAEKLGRDRSVFMHSKSGLVARDPDFKAAVEAAVEASVERAEHELYRRATEGNEEPVFQAGKQVGVTRKMDTVALIFYLKSRRPDVYRDNARVEHTGAAGGPIEVMQLVEGAQQSLRAKLAPVVDIRAAGTAAGGGS